MSGVLSGLNAWVVQRASAIYLLLFSMAMPLAIVLLDIDSFQAWQSFVLSPLVAISGLIFFASLLLHVWVGIRDVIIDYIHPFRLRLLVLAMLALYLIALMFWVLRLLFVSVGVHS